MKKILLLICALLCGSIVLAEISEIPPETTQQTVATATATMESITRNIDRRLVYINRYKKSDDMESLAKLISGENKDFYINFMKYVKVSPVFSLKRDPAVRIIKTPTGEYIMSAIMSVDGKEKKVSITFIEEKSDKGDKWLVVDSNLHIQFPLPAGGNNLASSALNTPTTTTTKSTDTSKKPVEETKPLVTVPTINKTDTPAKTTPTTIQKPVSKGLSTMDIIFITSAIIIGIGIVVFWLMMLIDCIRRKFEKKTLWILLLILLGIPASIAYYFIIKRKNISLTVPLAAATAVTTTLSSIEIDAAAAPMPAPLTPVESNVTVSTVEEIHNTPTSVSAENTISDTTELAPTGDASSTPEESPVEISENTTPADITSLETPTASTEEKTPQSEIEIPATEEVVDPSTPTPVSETAVLEENTEPVVQPVIEETTPEVILPTEENTETTSEVINTPVEENQESVVQTITEEINPISETSIAETPQIETPVSTIFSHPEGTPNQASSDIKSLDQIISDSSKINPFGENTTESTGNGQPHSLFESIFNPTPPKPETHGLFENILKSGN